MRSTFIPRWLLLGLPGLRLAVLLLALAVALLHRLLGQPLARLLARTRPRPGQARFVKKAPPGFQTPPRAVTTFSAGKL